METLVFATGVVAVVALGLRPIVRLRSQLATVDESRLDERFGVEHAPAELAPVIDQLNALFRGTEKRSTRTVGL